MKKLYLLPLLCLLVLFSLTIVSATLDGKYTKVAGRVSYQENNQPAGNADVTVVCSHNGSTYSRDTTTYGDGLLEGTYLVHFTQDQCINEDPVNVYATDGSLSGMESGEVKDWIEYNELDIDVAIINVHLVPEFGFFIGGLTILSAVGVFFLVRRE